MEKFRAEQNFKTRGGGYRDDVYFFPERLMARLRRISDYPVTLVEAPSGFGKTTAVRSGFLYRPVRLPPQRTLITE